MNPSNKALQRTIFIGGPPRVGKSIFAYRLAEKVNGHVVSTDAIRNAAKKACGDKTSDLFAVNHHESLSTEEWLKNHLDNPEYVVEVQNKESRAVWPSLISFCNSFVEDSQVHIVEGVAILPSLVKSMKHQPNHVFFVGNTSVKHVHKMIDYAQNNPQQDWMSAMGYGHDKIKAMSRFVREMSQYFKAEADKNGYLYYEISDDRFGDSLDKLIKQVSFIGL